MDPFIGEVRLFPFNFAPRNWADCNGAVLPIAQYTALFSILGTMYGGDGRSTFGLPDLRGRTVVGAGQGPSLTPRQPGERFGDETVTLRTAEMPAHVHRLNYKVVANSNTPMTGVPSTTVYPSRTTSSTTAPATGFAKAQTPLATLMAEQMLSPAGNSAPHENRQPYLGLRYCISLSGIFPQRA